MKDVLRKILTSLKVDLKDEFDRNFETKSFFGDKWPTEKHDNHRGSLMIRTGSLRRGLEADDNGGDSIRFYNSMPYATIHNEGGTTHPQVTPRLKAWAWHMYKETAEQFYKNLALTKKESLTVNIPKRQFLGAHPQVTKNTEDIISLEMDKFLKEFDKKIRP